MSATSTGTGRAPFGVDDLKAIASAASPILRAVANPQRAFIAIYLREHGEASVTDLERATGLSQSAISQHLAKMRSAGVVRTRRDAQTIYYRLAIEAVGAPVAAAATVAAKIARTA